MKFHRIVSFVFHPIIIPISSALLFFIIVRNSIFIPKQFAYWVLGKVFLMTYLVPILSLVFFKRIKLIDSFQLESVSERKFPVLFVGLVSFLTGLLLVKNGSGSVDILAFSFYGCALALLVVYLLLLFNIKASLHLLGIAGLIGFVTVVSFAFQKNLLIILMCLFILAGLIATSRLKLKAHNSAEILIGFLVGFMTQWISFFYFA